MAPLISVLLPARNAASTVESAVRSILEQTCRDLEVLLLDDRSDDDTAERVQRLADDRVRVVAATGPPGLVARLNQGIDIARGRYIARMDADDLSLPQRFERQVAHLEAHGEVDLVGGAIVYMDAGGKAIGLRHPPRTHAEICARPWNGILIAHPAWMGRADWFRRHRYHTPEYLRAEDQDLLLRAMPDSCYYNIADVVLAYRVMPPDINKLRTARASQLRFQLALFGERRERVFQTKAIGAFLIKSALDQWRTWSFGNTLGGRGVATGSLPAEVSEFVARYQPGGAG